MTQHELIQKDFQAKADILEAQRSFMRSQIGLLEAQLKENAVKLEELQFQWNRYVEGLQKQQAEANGEANPKTIETAPAKKKATAKS